MATITSTPVTTTNSTSSATTSSNLSSTTSSTLASNFQTFLTLLTTQLKNQNPLDPMDSNQFTQQLVQFAQVEQQLKQNDQLSSLVQLEKTAEKTAALAYVGQTVVVDGSTTALNNGQALWSLTSPKPSTATITITDSVGQTVYSTTTTLNSGAQNFSWNGTDSYGRSWADGNYKLTVAAKDSSGQDVAVTTEATGTVQSVDLTQSPPLLKVNGDTLTTDKVKRIIARS